jgi:hypothetical protein
MNVESKFQVSILFGQRNVYEPDQPSVSTSEINITTMLFCVVSYQPIYLTGRRTGINETKAYPTIRTYRLIVLTGDILKENAKTKKAIANQDLKISHGYGTFVVVRGREGASTWQRNVPVAH